jgi:hypothetical protein
MKYAVVPLLALTVLSAIGCGTSDSAVSKSESNIDAGAFQKDLEEKRKVGFEKFTPDQVISAFKKDGLGVGKTSDAKDEGAGGLAPDLAISGTRFLIPSLGEDSGGRIWSFSNPEDLEKMRKYYTELGESSAMLKSWVIVRENILVQINGVLPKEKAKKYEGSLNSIK